ncbi:MAG: hypothetical protein V7774_17370 [Pseudorhizobium pelagicum]|uniref:hypothetical protein n=1 Tax=Pseudorhizobium pelagicum TaxID=1509405 RepID=UPI0034615C46
MPRRQNVRRPARPCRLVQSTREAIKIDSMPKKQKRRKDLERPSKEAELSRLAKLEKAWVKASDEERLLFLKRVATQDVDLWSAIDPDRQQLIADGRYLLPSTVTRIERIMAKRSIRPDEVTAEMGFPGEGKTLVRALAKGASLRLAMVKALDAWLKRQALRGS